MDCISCHQAGFKNVVASSGTAFTAEQLKLLKRYSNNLSLSFDMDSAGQLAADRGIREAFTAEMNIKVITIPEGKDPDELIRKDVEAWKKAVAEAKHVMQYYFDKIFAAYNIEESEGKREAARRILPIIARLPDRIEQDHWLRKLAERLQVTETALRETLIASQVKIKKPAYANATADKLADTETAPRRESREEKLTQSLLALTVRFPSFFDYIVNHLNLDQIFGAENKMFYRNLIIYYNDIISNAENGRKEINYQDFRNWLQSQPDGLGNDGLFRLLEKIVILGDRDFYGLEGDKAKNEIIRVIIALKESYLAVRRKEISRLIAQLENEGRVEEAEKLMSELTRLSGESSENVAELENI
jgi:DNA primase